MGKPSKLRPDGGQSNRRGSWPESRPAVSVPAQARKSPPDRDRCPAGYDADVWHLALRFRQYAQDDKIELVAGLPVVYAELDDIIGRYGMRQKGYDQEVYGCDRRNLPDDYARRCWYHFPPGAPGQQVTRAITWTEMTEIIMAEFWSRIQDEHAAARFREHFVEYGMAAIRHWKSLRISKAIDEQPKDHARAVLRRRIGSGRMQSDSKEG